MKPLNVTDAEALSAGAELARKWQATAMSNAEHFRGTRYEDEYQFELSYWSQVIARLRKMAKEQGGTIERDT